MECSHHHLGDVLHILMRSSTGVMMSACTWDTAEVEVAVISLPSYSSMLNYFMKGKLSLSRNTSLASELVVTEQFARDCLNRTDP